MAITISLICRNVFAFLFLMHYCSCSLQTSFGSHSFKLSHLLQSNASACNQSSRSVRHPASLQIVNRYGPCIELLNHGKRTSKNSSSDSDYELQMLLQDQLRVDSMHAKFSKNSGRQFKDIQATIPVQSGIAIGTGNYLVTMSLGTPKKDFTLIFDTGSDITWTQCEPCLGSCYEQLQPKFDPSESSSYKNVSCSSSSCNLLTDSGAAKGCFSSTCLYKVEYGDGSYSIGFFAAEKLTISSSDVFNNFLFGCGQQNEGTLGKAAGLLGLGRSQLSFVMQTAYKYKKLFTYCLPSLSSGTGQLTFGGRVPNSVRFTPLSPDFQDTPFYGLDMTGISVGGYKLSIATSVFKSAGAIIDSGTVITRLQPTAYKALSSKFQEFMKDYPQTGGVSILDTCYDFSKYDTIVVPKISLFFKGGVEVEIDASGIVILLNRGKKVCLAFAPNSDDSDFAIFGNFQQKTFSVVHDLAKGRVGFAPSGCK